MAGHYGLSLRPPGSAALPLAEPGAQGSIRGYSPAIIPRLEGRDARRGAVSTHKRVRTGRTCARHLRLYRIEAMSCADHGARRPDRRAGNCSPSR